MSTERERLPPLDRETADAAMADLQELRELLRRADRGEVGSDQVIGSLVDYWRDHGPLVRRAASSAAELLRLQILSELYQWRDQLNAQLQARKSAASTRARSSDASVANGQSGPSHTTD